MGRRGRRRAREQPVLARLGAHGTGDRFGPVAAAWQLGGIGELLALHGAETPEALQRTLVIPGHHNDTRPDEASWTFKRAHDGATAGLPESVVLAVTNHRWNAIARQVLERLDDEGLLDVDVGDALALVLLEDDVVPITVPGAWLVEFYLQRRREQWVHLDPAKTYTLWRSFSPQVRRWAAARRAGEGEGVAWVLRRVLQMDHRHGAAAMLGLVDATERLDEAQALDLLERAASWSSPDVRLAAFKSFAGRGLEGEALERAAADRAAHIRRWAAGFVAHAAAAPEPEQQSLFA